MSDQGTIFDKPVVDGSTTPASEGSFGDLLKGITNEAGEQKYSDVPKALDALATSQKYIPELHDKLDTKDKQIADLREELTKRKAVEDVVETLRASRNEPAADQPKGLDAAEAAELFDQLVTKREQQTVRTQNVQAVTSKLVETHGDKAEAIFYETGAKFGLSPEALNDLAGTSPAAVLQLFGKESADTSVDVSKGSVNLDVTPTQDGALMERNKGTSVLMGSTSRDVKAEFDIVKGIVAKLHEAGGTVEDLSDPKEYRKYFG